MFTTIVFCLVIMLLLLAALDLFVGVSNDACNFLNSALGTKIAPLSIVLVVASVGVIAGATFSSGMMEVARKGMLFPEMFTIKDMILIFVSVMVADVILLNIFNSFGLPTSTTVSIIFELLGAACFAAAYKLYSMDLSFSEIFNYIKLDKTATIVSAILLSVVISFIAGMIVQFVCRVAFSFNFQKSVKALGGIFAGLCLTAIFYFLVMKGAKGASFMKPEYLTFMKENMFAILSSVFVAFAVIGQLMVLLNMNVFKLIVLAGTFALAFSFAGNDLVNFVGVPLAALDCFNYYVDYGNGDESMLMANLNDSAAASTTWLVLSGVIMCITLWVSKKALQVIQTSINLSSSKSGSREQFGASTLGRIITRMGLVLCAIVYRSMPKNALKCVKGRYEPVRLEKGQEALPFDYVRACINLVVAAVLISVATSLKLPLSTTYVTFMVAMGTSFADGAWDRETAVFRISGVLTVIAGWFLTGICAFTMALIVGLVVFNFGLVSALILTPLVFGLVIYSNFFKKSKKDAQIAQLQSQNDAQILHTVSSAVPNYFRRELDCFEKSLNAFYEDNEIALRKVRNKSAALGDRLSLKRSTYYALATDAEILKDSNNTSDSKFFFYQVYSNMRDASESVHKVVDQMLNHVANRHNILAGHLKDSVFELLYKLNNIESYLKYVCDNPYRDAFETVLKNCKKLNHEIDKWQIRLVGTISTEHLSIHQSEIYLSILQAMRDLLNRYMTVCMQEHALSELVYGNAEKQEKVGKRVPEKTTTSNITFEPQLV